MRTKQELIELRENYITHMTKEQWEEDFKDWIELFENAFIGGSWIVYYQDLPTNPKYCLMGDFDLVSIFVNLWQIYHEIKLEETDGIIGNTQYCVFAY